MKYFISANVISTELLSIGIKSYDGRELYLVSKDIDSKLLTDYESIKAIFDELNTYIYNGLYWKPLEFSFRNAEELIKKHGKSRQEIAEEVYKFCANSKSGNLRDTYLYKEEAAPEFYGFNCEYDYKVFEWLFKDSYIAPIPFPMYWFDMAKYLPAIYVTRVIEKTGNTNLDEAIWLLKVFKRLEVVDQ